jgi:putative oxidoreductase
MSDAVIDRRRLLVPSLAGLYELVSPLSYTLMRVTLGLVLMPHGVMKLFFDDAPNAAKRMVALGLPNPMAWAYFIGALEFFGGAMLAVGLLTRIAAAGIAIQMAVISFLVLWPNWFWGNRGIEYPVMMMLFALAFAFGGGGRYSLDRLIGKEL